MKAALAALALLPMVSATTGIADVLDDMIDGEALSNYKINMNGNGGVCATVNGNVVTIDLTAADGPWSCSGAPFFNIGLQSEMTDGTPTSFGMADETGDGTPVRELTKFKMYSDANFNFDGNVSLQFNTDDGIIVFVPNSQTISGSDTVELNGPFAIDVEGCTDSAYTEFDATANVDDGSCSTSVAAGGGGGDGDGDGGAAAASYTPPFKPADKAALQAQVNACQPDGTFTTWNNSNTVCDDVENWDTSLVTNMRAVFIDKWTFNEDISAWDVSNVNDFAYMFRRDFNQDLSSWQIKPTAGLTYMFDGTAMNHQLCGAAWVDREQAGTIPANMLSAGSGSVATCTLCPVGQYANTSQSDCVACPADFETKRAGQTHCTPMPPCSYLENDIVEYQKLGCCEC